MNVFGGIYALDCYASNKKEGTETVLHSSS